MWKGKKLDESNQCEWNECSLRCSAIVMLLGWKFGVVGMLDYFEEDEPGSIDTRRFMPLNVWAQISSSQCFLNLNVIDI